MKLRKDLNFSNNSSYDFYNNLPLQVKIQMNKKWKLIKYNCDICNFDVINDTFKKYKKELLGQLTLFNVLNDELNIKKTKFKISLLILMILFQKQYINKKLFQPIESEVDRMIIDYKIDKEDWKEVSDILKIE